MASADIESCPRCCLAAYAYEAWIAWHCWLGLGRPLGFGGAATCGAFCCWAAAASRHLLLQGSCRFGGELPLLREPLLKGFRVAHQLAYVLCLLKGFRVAHQFAYVLCCCRDGHIANDVVSTS